ncbi:MAG: trigger factor [Desulfovibrionaceae bacterium]|nr:trigger factor [Desulfovibrionaceae bacterium]
MEYDIQDISPVQKKIVFKVQSEEVNGALSTAVALYKTRYEIKGFRKGRAPASVIESKFKKQLYTEATTDLINYQINEAINSLGLAPLSRIEVEAKELVRDQDFEYSISFEVAPEFELPEYKGLVVEEEAVEVDEARIREVENRILDNAATITPIEDVREPRDGEIVTVSFGTYKDGELFDGVKAENFDLVLGQKQALEEFEDLVKGLKPGESGEREIAFPKDFINTNMAGQTLTIKAKLHAIKQKDIPKLTDELAKRVAGFDSVATMREAIKASFLSSQKQLVRGKSQSELLDRLLKDLDYPLPPSMVEDRLQRLIEDQAFKLERQGRSLESLGKSLEELRAEFRPRAEQAVKQELFLLAVAKKEGLEVDPKEVEAALRQVAMQAKQDVLFIRQFYEQNNMIVPLKDRLLADKAMEAIYQQVEIREVPAAEAGA